jgi:hypothetical protein
VDLLQRRQYRYRTGPRQRAENGPHITGAPASDVIWPASRASRWARSACVGIEAQCPSCR